MAYLVPGTYAVLRPASRNTRHAGRRPGPRAAGACIAKPSAPAAPATRIAREQERSQRVWPGPSDGCATCHQPTRRAGGFPRCARPVRPDLLDRPRRLRVHCSLPSRFGTKAAGTGWVAEGLCNATTKLHTTWPGVSGPDITSMCAVPRPRKEWGLGRHARATGGWGLLAQGWERLVLTTTTACCYG